MLFLNNNNTIEIMKSLNQFLTEANNGYKPKHHMDNNEAGALWDEVTEAMGGPEKILDAIFQMLDTDTCVWLIEAMNSDYELEIDALV